MSHLKISHLATTYQMNVVAFSSPIYETIASAQTRTKAVHFPIKVTQPDIEFSVMFSNEIAFESFQRFVRDHQQNVQSVTSLLTLSWPERNINDWTGFITKFQAGGARRNYVPRASFTVDLVDSMASSRTELASRASSWRAIYGGLGADSVLTPPPPQVNQFFAGGANPLGRGTTSVPANWPN